MHYYCVGAQRRELLLCRGHKGDYYFRVHERGIITHKRDTIILWRILRDHYCVEALIILVHKREHWYSLGQKGGPGMDRGYGLCAKTSHGLKKSSRWSWQAREEEGERMTKIRNDLTCESLSLTILYRTSICPIFDDCIIYRGK